MRYCLTEKGGFAGRKYRKAECDTDAAFLYPGTGRTGTPFVMICVLCAELIGMGMEKINIQVLTQTLGRRRNRELKVSNIRTIDCV